MNWVFPYGWWHSLPAAPIRVDGAQGGQVVVELRKNNRGTEAPQKQEVFMMIRKEDKFWKVKAYLF